VKRPPIERLHFMMEVDRNKKPLSALRQLKIIQLTQELTRSLQLQFFMLDWFPDHKINAFLQKKLLSDQIANNEEMNRFKSHLNGIASEYISQDSRDGIIYGNFLVLAIDLWNESTDIFFTPVTSENGLANGITFNATDPCRSLVLYKKKSPVARFIVSLKKIFF
jgi:hypothetical protein